MECDGLCAHVLALGRCGWSLGQKQLSLDYVYPEFDLERIMKTNLSLSDCGKVVMSLSWLCV